MYTRVLRYQNNSFKQNETEFFDVLLEYVTYLKEIFFKKKIIIKETPKCAKYSEISICKCTLYYFKKESYSFVILQTIEKVRKLSSNSDQ